MKVAEIMTTDPICAVVPGTRDELFELIKKTNLTSFPVIKEDTKELVGIVTETDIVNKPTETQLALLMTKEPQTTTPKENVENIINTLYKNGFRQLPVVEKNKLVGMITIGDIISKVISIASSEKTINEYMTKSILGVWQETPLPICQKIMDFAKSESAIIFDDEVRMVGIVTMIDFVKLFEAIRSEKIDEMISGEGKEGSCDSVSTIIVHTKDLTLPNIPVKEIMTKDVITTFSKATISEVAKKMSRMELYQIPVVNAKGDVVGIIRDFDLLKAYSSD